MNRSQELLKTVDTFRSAPIEQQLKQLGVELDALRAEVDALAVVLMALEYRLDAERS